MNIFKTSDLALAAYMVTFGLKLVSAKKLPTGRFHFELEDPNSEAQKMSVEFINSDFCKFDNNVKILKKMIYSS
tara:strand:- start:4779 stop:5000 length:222 start_codon:yes stop_codon:yes gene_type:complete